MRPGSEPSCYERRDAALANTLDLEPMRRNARGARYGFPMAALRVYLPRLLLLGRSVLVVGEEDEYFTAVKTRAPVCWYEPLPEGRVALRTEGTSDKRSGAKPIVYGAV
jgi:hypothetical protein